MNTVPDPIIPLDCDLSSNQSFLHVMDLNIKAIKLRAKEKSKATRCDAIRRATPSWLSKEQKTGIQSVYDCARSMTLSSGILHHVDHIIPLKGRAVCGLHVSWNLQVLTRDENVRKSNKVCS
jgi:5-methylcytosine-specific restriction endonuclease McrA